MLGVFAGVAGVSTRAIRRWHEIGLLPEPERRSNGYKRYDTTHLVRVLRIKRLSSLGFRLDRVGEMLDGAVPEGQLPRTQLPSWPSSGLRLTAGSPSLSGCGVTSTS
ncbi:hypothetical protein ACI1US_01833 [Leucobacter sp. BZR 635]